MDKKGSYHFLPYWVGELYRFTTGEDDPRGMHMASGEHQSKSMQIFGNPANDSETIVSLADPDSTDYSATDSQGLSVGWGTVIPSNILNGPIDPVTGKALGVKLIALFAQDGAWLSRNKVIQTSKMMWKDLNAIIARSRFPESEREQVLQPSDHTDDTVPSHTKQNVHEIEHVSAICGVKPTDEEDTRAGAQESSRSPTNQHPQKPSQCHINQYSPKEPSKSLVNQHPQASNIEDSPSLSTTARAENMDPASQSHAQHTPLQPGETMHNGT